MKSGFTKIYPGMMVWGIHPVFERFGSRGDQSNKYISFETEFIPKFLEIIIIYVYDSFK